MAKISPLREFEARVVRIDKIAGTVSHALAISKHTYLRSASTTMNITLSKGAGTGSSPWYVASPGRKGLYGKNPFANTSIAIGSSTLAKAARIDRYIAISSLRYNSQHQVQKKYDCRPVMLKECSVRGCRVAKAALEVPLSMQLNQRQFCSSYAVSPTTSNNEIIYIKS